MNLFKNKFRNMTEKEIDYTHRFNVMDDTRKNINYPKHEILKQQKLESVKKNILMHLHMSKPPNIETLVVIPEKILKNFDSQMSKLNDYNQKKISTTEFPKSAHEPINAESSTYELDKKSVQNFKEAFLQRDQYNYYINYNTSTEANTTRKDFYEYKDTENTQRLRTSFPTEQSDPLLSSLTSVYIFPKQSFLSRNHKAAIFKFIFVETPLKFSRVVLHIFLRGFDWIRESQPSILYKIFTENYNIKRHMTVITVYKLYSGNKRSTHTFKIIESYHKIPTGAGNWVEIDITNFFEHWLTNPSFETSLVVRGQESWTDSLLWTDKKGKQDSVNFYVEIEATVRTRKKRSTVLDCSENGNEKRCCRYPLKINFSNFGWNFIVAPQHFDAYFCNGECNFGYLEKYTHTHITSLSSSAKPCCSPQKLNSLTLLYFDMTMKLMYSTIPNMSVEKCSCS